jgi:P4 family phage/plasmid primase-like protien
LPADAAQWLQLRLGQGMTGYPPPDDVGVFLRGSGANGKTSIVDGVRGAAGDYAVPLPERVLLARAGDHPTELMTLRGARIAFMEELPELGHLNVKRWKQLHGTQEISARLCGRDTVTWKATHSTFVTTNYLPRVDESDHGTWRRLALVEFPYRYRKSHEQLEIAADRRGDPGLRQRLREGPDGQHEAVLAWLVEGALAWYRNGRVMPPLPASVDEATKRWRGSVDLLGRYLDENIVFDVERHVMTRDLYADFSKWLKDSGHLAWSEQNFTARLQQHEEVVTASVEKKSKHRKSGSGRSRKAFCCSPVEVPKQYQAWVGMKFRLDADEADEQHV